MKTLAKTSLIMGVISVALNIIAIGYFIPIVIILLGVGAIICGILSIKEFHDLSFSGIVSGTCGILIALVWLYLTIIA